jgi:hypothetical protein
MQILAQSLASERKTQGAKKRTLRLFELARVPVRFDHVARCIVNAEKSLSVDALVGQSKNLYGLPTYEHISRNCPCKYLRLNCAAKSCLGR